MQGCSLQGGCPPQGGGSITRPMVSGRWYDQQTAGVYNPGANVPVSGTPLYMFVPFVQWRLQPVNFAQIGLDVDSVPTSDVNIRLGIYSDENGQPNQLLKELEITVAATDPTGPLEFPFVVTLSPGVYWICFINNAANSLRLNGWDSGAATEGYSMLGDNSPAGATSIPKRWGWSLPGAYPIVSLPTSFLSTALNVTDRIVRLCLQVA